MDPSSGFDGRRRMPDLGRSCAILRVVSLRRSLEGAAATETNSPGMTPVGRP